MQACQEKQPPNFSACGPWGEQEHQMPLERCGPPKCPTRLQTICQEGVRQYDQGELQKLDYLYPNSPEQGASLLRALVSTLPKQQATSSFPGSWHGCRSHLEALCKHRAWSRSKTCRGIGFPPPASALAHGGGLLACVSKTHTSGICNCQW